MEVNEVNENLFKHVYVRPNVVFNFLFDHGFNLFWLDHQHTRKTFMEAYKKSSLSIYFASPDKTKGPSKTNFTKWKKLATKAKRVAHLKEFAAQFKANFVPEYGLCHVDYEIAKTQQAKGFASLDRLR